MRTYIVEFWDGRHCVHAPNVGIVVQSKRRIRQLVVEIFRRFWGGRNPTFWWGKDGFMAQAFDEGRNLQVLVQQVNRDNPKAMEMVRGVLPYKEIAT